MKAIDLVGNDMSMWAHQLEQKNYVDWDAGDGGVCVYVCVCVHEGSSYFPHNFIIIWIALEKKWKTYQQPELAC